VRERERERERERVCLTGSACQHTLCTVLAHCFVVRPLHAVCACSHSLHVCLHTALCVLCTLCVCVHIACMFACTRFARRWMGASANSSQAGTMPAAVPEDAARSARGEEGGRGWIGGQALKTRSPPVRGEALSSPCVLMLYTYVFLCTLMLCSCGAGRVCGGAGAVC